jgi:hypothetical protein
VCVVLLYIRYEYIYIYIYPTSVQGFFCYDSWFLDLYGDSNRYCHVTQPDFMNSGKEHEVEQPLRVAVGDARPKFRFIFLARCHNDVRWFYMEFEVVLPHI